MSEPSWTAVFGEIAEEMRAKNTRIADLERELERELELKSGTLERLRKYADASDLVVADLEMGTTEDSRRIADLERKLAAMRRDRDGWKAAAEEAIEERAAQSKADAREIERCRAELAARPVVDPPEARKLREAWASYRCGSNYASQDRLSDALRAFCESAPPASAASEESRRHLEHALETVSMQARQVQAQAAEIRRDCAAEYASDREVFERSERQNAELNRRVANLTAQLNEQAAKHAEEGERWSREMGEKDEELRSLRAELAALKDAPRYEREVDRELRDALRCSASWESPSERLLHALDRWLAAPLAQQSEYVRAAVEYAEAAVSHYKCRSGESSARENAAYYKFLPLYDARKRGEQEKVGCASDAGSIMLNRPTHPTLDVVAPAPAPSERVTVYVHRVNANKFRPAPAEIVLFSKDFTGGEYSCIGTLALDARVVEEGGV